MSLQKKLTRFTEINFVCTIKAKIGRNTKEPKNGYFRLNIKLVWARSGRVGLGWERLGNYIL